jgi:hypothetical protein
VSWFTFKDLFWRCHFRQICAPTLSLFGFARDQLNHSIAAESLRRLTSSPQVELSGLIHDYVTGVDIS